MAYDLTKLRAEHRSVFREAEESSLIPDDVVEQMYALYSELKKLPKQDWNKPASIRIIETAVESAALKMVRQTERKLTQASLNPSAQQLKMEQRKAARHAARLDERAKVISEGQAHGR